MNIPTIYADSATSEFFINHKDNPALDYGYIVGDSDYYNNGRAYTQVGYCVFGKVISGIDVVDEIADVNTIEISLSMEAVPVNDVIIQNATVFATTPYCPEKLQGDIDGDCDVDADDITKFSILWLNPKCVGCYNGDFNNDGEIDFTDFAMITQNWLSCSSITTLCANQTP